MKPKPITIILLLIYLNPIHSNGQEASYKDSIEMVQTFLGGVNFYQHDKKLTNKEIHAAMRPNPEALKYFNKSRTNNAFAFAAGFIGGFLIGYELGGALTGKDITWGVMGAGAGFIVIGIPFDIASKRNARKAVLLYNAAFR